MRKVTMVLFYAAFVLPAIVFPSLASGAPAKESGVTFKDVEGKEWFLSEVKSAGKVVLMDRKKLEADDMGKFFSIIFQKDNASDGGRVGGTAAPNSYFGPYTPGDNRALSIGNMASTLMMAIKEPEGLRENEYFNYLAKVTRWDLRNGEPELYCSGSNGDEVILVFTLK
jgi:heat shock protein HslJ